MRTTPHLRTRWHTGALPRLGLLLLLLPACTGVGIIRGQVLDAQTKQPVPGAIVLGVWTKQETILFPITKLIGVKEVEVDAQGRFELDRPLGVGIEESVTVYKFGYVAWNNEVIFPSYQDRPDLRVPPQLFLELFPPGESHQKHMMFVRYAMRSGMHYIENRPKFSDGIMRESSMP